MWCVTAYPNFKDALPNGNHVPHPCKVNYMWHGVGHHNPLGGGITNKFGMDFKEAGKVCIIKKGYLCMHFNLFCNILTGTAYPSASHELIRVALAAKQDGKARQMHNILPVSKARTNKLYIFRQCTYIAKIALSGQCHDNKIILILLMMMSALH